MIAGGWWDSFRSSPFGRGPDSKRLGAPSSSLRLTERQGGCFQSRSFNSPRFLVGNLVAACLPARRAIIKTIAAQADVHLPLAGATVLLAIALALGHFALHAVVLVFGGGGHGRTLARGLGKWKVPLVTTIPGLPTGPTGGSVEATAERMLG